MLKYEPLIKTVERLEEFPDIPVPSGTRVYQDFDDGRIFEICIVRGT